MKAELQHQAERLKSQIEELQQTLRRARLGIIMTLQDLEDIEDPALEKSQPATNDHATARPSTSARATNVKC